MSYIVLLAYKRKRIKANRIWKRKRRERKVALLQGHVHRGSTSPYARGAMDNPLVGWYELA